MAKKTKWIGYEGKDSKNSPELMMREAFLRTVRESLDNFGIESFSIESIRGATVMLEKFLEINKE